MIESLQTRDRFVLRYLEAISPKKANGKAYESTRICKSLADKIGLTPGKGLPLDSFVPKIIEELKAVEQDVLTGINIKPGVDTVYDLQHSLGTFCDDNKPALANWIKNNGSIREPAIAGLFFAICLFRGDNNNEQQASSFFSDCLKSSLIAAVGEGSPESLSDALFAVIEKDFLAAFMNDAEVEGNRAVRLFLATTICWMSRFKKDELVTGAIEPIERYLKTLYRDELYALTSMNSAAAELKNAVCVFEPRSIQTREACRPEEYFVMPTFCLASAVDEKRLHPLAGFGASQRGVRRIVVAKTGLGKTSYMRILALCASKAMAEERFAMGDEMLNGIIDDFGEKKPYVMYIPAKMFSYCYQNPRYRHLTTDFVKLYFTSMRRIQPGVDLFSDTLRQRSVDEVVHNNASELVVDEALARILFELARVGKLVVLLDSFDELPAGEMRNAYLKALAAFCDDYGFIPDAGEVGAHVLITSRELSKDTMASLAHHAFIKEGDVFGIDDLEPEQQRRLVLNWNKYFDKFSAEERTDEMMAELASNHFYSEYAINPYMLSVSCFYFQQGFNLITQKFIDALIRRVTQSYQSRLEGSSSVVQIVLANMRQLLQELAGETVLNDTPKFSEATLVTHIRRRLASIELSERDIEHYAKELQEAFVTGVGLIVPADGEDDAYQFINELIRFELAAKGIHGAFGVKEQEAVLRDMVLPAMSSLSEYVGLVIPLICSMSSSDIPLSERLVFDLAMYDFQTEEEDFLVQRALYDLMLGRYDANILTIFSVSGARRQIVRRAQRIAIMRIFATNAYSATDEEKAALLDCSAFRVNSQWCRTEQ